jgi:hypothetical protein
MKPTPKKLTLSKETLRASDTTPAPTKRPDLPARHSIVRASAPPFGPVEPLPDSAVQHCRPHGGQRIAARLKCMRAIRGDSVYLLL